MFEPPDHYRNLSLRLSEVLDDIGVNERLVMKRRRITMLSEAMENIMCYIENKPRIVYNFGSQTEATTTLGLKSDFDNLNCNLQLNVIQDWSDWELGKVQLLMVQDETTSPGYCLLQRLRPDVPMPLTGIQIEHSFIDDRDRVLVRHSQCLGDIIDGSVRHGPAENRHFGLIDLECDCVIALRCLSWPKEAYPWLQQQHVGGWPTADMKRYSAEQGCFFVPVSSKNGVYEGLEWRISTSLAERCLMFSLNITQMRCYILMKMILKCHIKPKCGEVISSFMCKNVLFHCIAASRPSEWRECNLMTCLTRCLQGLFDSILTENCPHFMIPRNNLLAGKLSHGIKQRLVEVMYTLTRNIEQALLGISIDDLGSRIMVKSGLIYGDNLHSAADNATYISSVNVFLLAGFLDGIVKQTCKNIANNDESISQILVQKVYVLCQLYAVGSMIEQAACKLLTPFLCSIVSTVIASADIQHAHAISPEALLWFSAGLNSDISSSRLKLASALYCAGDLERCEILLADLEIKFGSEIIENTCGCCENNSRSSKEFDRLCFDRNEAVIKHNMAVCVKYFPCEVNCIPAELKFELFRSTVDDLPYRNEFDDWMDWAVADSLPYLYFLQYKVYSQFRRPADQYRALDNLARTIGTEPTLGHRETALNLLGQCMEQENRKEDALRCFMLSLNLRERNNAAKWHVCRMLAALFR